MHILLVFIMATITAFRVFWNLGEAPVERWDEQTNIDVVSDTINNQSFPVLTYGNKPFFEKPPLWYFAGIAIGSVTPVSLLSMRTISALFGFLTITFTAYLAWRWWGWIAGFISWITALTTNHLFVTNPAGVFSTHTFRSADVDSMLMFFLIAAYAASVKMPSSTRAAALTGVFTGLAVLTKGPIGFLPLFITSLQSKRSFVAWIIAIVTVCPWYAMMVAQFGMTFIHQHAGYHLLKRATMPIEGHNHPLWYYVSILTNRAFFLSWEILVFALVWLLIRRNMLRDRRTRSAYILTLAFIIVPTLIQTRLAWYLLPLYPFAALTVGRAASGITLRETS